MCLRTKHIEAYNKDRTLKSSKLMASTQTAPLGRAFGQSQSALGVKLFSSGDVHRHLNCNSFSAVRTSVIPDTRGSI